MRAMTVCIAGVGSIAVEAIVHIRTQFPELDLIVLTNDDRLSRTTWQTTIAHDTRLSGLVLANEQEAYDSEDLLLLALNHPMHEEARKFRSKRKFKIHFSLLPKYRGYHTASWPILNGDLQSGTTLHILDSGFDTGEIIDQNAFYIFGNYTARDMLSSYMEHGLRLLKSNLPSLLSGQYSVRRQPVSGATFYGEDSLASEKLSINFNATAHQVSCQIRAHILDENRRPYFLASQIYAVEVLSARSLDSPSTVIQKSSSFYDVATTDYDVRVFIRPLGGPDELLQNQTASCPAT